MIITKKSELSGIERTMDIPLTEENLKALQSGMHIQHACPNLTADEREFMLTGITAEEWDEAFSDEDNQIL